MIKKPKVFIKYGGIAQNRERDFKRGRGAVCSMIRDVGSQELKEGNRGEFSHPHNNGDERNGNSPSKPRRNGEKTPSSASELLGRISFWG